MAISVRLKGSLLAAAGIWLAGCDALTAPVSIPEAIGENANFSLSGPVLDQDGQPLDGVIMSKQWSHHFWQPGYGGIDTDEHSLQRVDGHYAFSERGTSLEVKFSKEGYFPETYEIKANDSHYLKTLDGDWKIRKDFPVVLYSTEIKHSIFFRLEGTLDCTHYPVGDALCFEPLSKSRINVAGTAKQPNTLYITMKTEPPRPSNANGDLDPAEANLPASITLHISDPEGGLIRIEPKPGYDPMHAVLAPKTGYLPELTIDRARLLEMRRSPLTRFAEAREYFYFKVANFGKGQIQWSEPAADNNVHPVIFHYYLWKQDKENDADLATRVEALKTLMMAGKPESQSESSNKRFQDGKV